jgi:N-acetylglucosaminyl-diphospho-decaprenol L-rhamnosyltransferase
LVETSLDQMTGFESLTVVVVDWNLPDHTVRCVESLIADGVPRDRIVVVENGPTTDNWAQVTGRLGGSVLVRVETNVGFGRASNIGARVLPGDGYLFVNNDAHVNRAGSVAALLRSLEEDRVGIVVPKILNPDLSLQPTVVPLTTPLPALVRASGISRFVPDRWQPHVSTHWSHGWAREIEAATGAVMLVDGRALECLAGFRETSFMYAEDLDLCWRARDLGWRTWFTNEAEFVHLASASADRRWGVRQRWQRIGQAEAQMMREHLSPSQSAAAFAFTRLGLAGRLIYFRATRNGAAAARYRGFLDGLGSAPADEREDRVDSPAIDVVRP